MQTAGVSPRLLDGASWAPSPHNTQPWLVHPRSDTVAELYVPTRRTLPHTDASGAFITNALGIFVEALDVAAAAEGLAVKAEPLYPKLGAESEERPLFARLRLAERSEPPRFPLELLVRRQTARGAYDRPADGATIAALQAIVGEAGHEARFTSDRELVDWVVGLNADTLCLCAGLVRAVIFRACPLAPEKHNLSEVAPPTRGRPSAATSSTAVFGSASSPNSR